MSREWSRAAFAPAEAAPKSFVPQGFSDGAVALDMAALAETMRGARGGFQATGVRRGPAPGGFVAAGFGRTATAPVHEPTADAPIELVPEPIPEPTPQPIDAQAVFDAGVAEGTRRAAATSAADADACAKLLSSFAGASRFDRGDLAARLRQTVLHLVGQIVGEVGISPERLGSRVDEAVRLLADVTEPARLSLHPDDLAMMQGRLAANIAAVPDATMERGGFRLETMSATVEDGPTLWLEQLETALDRVAAPGE